MIATVITAIRSEVLPAIPTAAKSVPGYEESLKGTVIVGPTIDLWDVRATADEIPIKEFGGTKGASGVPAI